MFIVKNKKVQLLALIIFLLGIVNIPSFSLAENQIEVQEDEISVNVTPKNPGPYENVTITLSSYTTDLNKATISWQSSSGTDSSGIGKTSYSFTTDKVGHTSTINIMIQPAGGAKTISKRIVINPSEIEIMWESVDGYTPPFYKGKSLPVSGSLIKAVAIPNTNSTSSGITYTWKNHDSVVEDASGYNKNSYIFKNSSFDDVNSITVTASSVNNNYNAETSVEIPAYKPKIVFYKKSPTEGILYNNALEKDTTMAEDEMTLVAEPYFMSLKGNEDKFTYTWKVNSNNINTPAERTEITVRPTSRGGYATIGLTIENLNELFQKVSNQLKLEL